MADCKHEESYWAASVNEDGWVCISCGRIGFRPDLDRAHTGQKVIDILTDLHVHDEELVYVPNGSTGDCIAEAVANRCHKEGRFTQHDILRFILDDPNVTRGDYWKVEAEKWLANKEPGVGKER